MTSPWSVALASSVVTCGVLGALVPACTGTPDSTTTTMEVAVEGEGTVSIDESSTVCPPDCEASQDVGAAGATWTVTATPAEGWELVEWQALDATTTCPGETSASFTEEVSADGGTYGCRAVFRRVGTEDPEDLGVDPDGDPSLDVVLVDTWHTPEDGVVACTSMSGAWPPDDALWSWYVSFTLYASTGAELGTATLQRHSGSRSTPITGLTPSAVAFVERGDGVCLSVAAPIDATHVSIESGVQAASTGTRVSDAVPDAGEPIAIDARIAPAP